VICRLQHTLSLLQLVANCEQILSTRYSRRLIAMQVPYITALYCLLCS
jgi:hypothetical protein